MKPKTTLGFYLVVAQFFLMAEAMAMPVHTTHELIVKYREASLEDILSNKGSVSTPAFILRLSVTKNLKLHKAFPSFNIYAFEMPAGKNVDEMMRELEDDPNVEFSEPNYVIKTDRFSLTAFALESSRSIDSLGVFELKPQATDPILVGVVDTGIDTTHPALQSRIWMNTQEISSNGRDDDGNGYIDDIQGWNFADGTNDAFDDNGHGTHVAGIISGVSTFAVDTTSDFKLVPLKFLDADGTGTTLGAISAISYGLQIGVKVFNNSWGGGGFSMALHDVMTQAYEKGVLMVVAAGNESQDLEISPTYPASFEHPNLLSIAASTSLGSLAWFSNFGKKSVDVAAPGVSIYSSMPNGMYGYMSGTSMATPYVSRVAMLMMDQNRGISSFQVKEIIMDTATFVAELDPIIASGGIVDASKAILEAQSTVPDGVIPPYTPLTTSLSSEYDPQNSVDMGPSGCGIITTSGPSDWTGGNTLSLILVAFFFVLIQLPARIQVSWVNVR